MSNTDRSIAATVRRMDEVRHDAQLQRMASYWYACSYNDHRHPPGEIGAPKRPYVDPQEFSEYWLTLVLLPSHPSVQDAFKAFKDGLR